MADTQPWRDAAVTAVMTDKRLPILALLIGLGLALSIGRVETERPQPGARHARSNPDSLS